MNGGRCRFEGKFFKVAMALSYPVDVIGPRAVEFKNNKQKMFQQHLGTVSTTMICFDKSGLCFTIPNESARLKSLRQKVFSTLPPHIMEIYSISEMFRNFIDRFWVEFEWKGKLFREALFLRVLCKTKDLQQSSIVSPLNKIFQTRVSWSDGMNWKGLMDWMNSTCRSLTRPNVNCPRPFFQLFTLNFRVCT